MTTPKNVISFVGDIALEDLSMAAAGVCFFGVGFGWLAVVWAAWWRSKVATRESVSRLAVGCDR